MAITYVQSAKAHSGGAVVFTNPVSAGNLVVVGVCNFGVDPGAADVSDNKGNTYTRINHQGPVDSGVNYQGIYYAKNVAGGSTFTVTVTNGDTLFIVEYAGADTTAPLDQTSIGATGNNAAPKAASITPTQDNELIVGVAWSNQDSDVWGTSASFTLRQNETDNNSWERGAIADLIQTTAAAVQASFTTSSSAAWGALSASFKAAAISTAQTGTTKILLSKVGN